MSGQQQNRNPSEDQNERQNPAQPGWQGTNQPSSTLSLFNSNYRGPQYTTNASGASYIGPAQGYNASAYNQGQGRVHPISQFGQVPSPAPGHGRGFPSGRGGYQGRGVAAGRVPPYSGPPNPFPQFAAGYPPQGYQQQHPGRGAGQRGTHRPTVPPSNRPPPAGPQPTQSRGRPAPATAIPGPPPRPFGDDDFPSLDMGQSRPPAPRQQPDVDTGSTGRHAARGGRRGRFVPFTDFNPGSSSTADVSRQQAPSLPPPRSRRNNVFRLGLDQCYRGKIVFIDELAGLDYSAHPAVIRSVDRETRRIRFYKKSSFKSIGGFLNKYGEYVNRSQKRWHEKQWLLVDDGTTEPHHGTPLLRLANGEMMPEKGSYVDIHGDTELPIDYFSKYSRFGSFPEIYLPEDQMKLLEAYSKWYLEKDGEYRQAEEKKRKERWQMDGSAEVDVGDIYEDSENEDDGQ